MGNEGAVLSWSTRGHANKEHSVEVYLSSSFLYVPWPTEKGRLRCALMGPLAQVDLLKG